MLQRIAHLLFVACLWIAPISVFLYVMDLSDSLIYWAYGSISVILAYTAYAFVLAYKELTRPADPDTDDMTKAPPARKWHLLTTRITAGLMAFAVVCVSIGVFGDSLVPFIFGFTSLVLGILVTVLSAMGLFEKMDNKRNEKLFPKPKREPAPPIPKLPKPETLPGYQYSFDF